MDEAVWEAARSVRPYLWELVGPDAPAVDAALAELLTDSDVDEHTQYRLRNVLESHEATGIFLQRIREDTPAHRPPQVLSEQTKRYTTPAGDPSPVPADKFACPHGDYVWYQPEVGARVPPCPTHHCALQPA
jgi:hypothetical protein